MQYFFDQNKEELHFAAIAFCSAHARRCDWVRFVVRQGTKPAAVVTSNAGRTWTLMRTGGGRTTLCSFSMKLPAGW